MQHYTLSLQAVPAGLHDIGNLVIERVRKRDVADNSLLEERPGPEALGPVNHLVGNHKVPRLDGLLQTAHGRECDDGADSNRS